MLIRPSPSLDTPPPPLHLMRLCLHQRERRPRLLERVHDVVRTDKPVAVEVEQSGEVQEVRRGERGHQEKQ